jgi:hypothetical protein
MTGRLSLQELHIQTGRSLASKSLSRSLLSNNLEELLAGIEGHMIRVPVLPTQWSVATTRANAGSIMLENNSTRAFTHNYFGVTKRRPV